MAHSTDFHETRADSIGFVQESYTEFHGSRTNDLEGDTES